MQRYSIDPGTRKIAKGYGFSSLCKKTWKIIIV